MVVYTVPINEKQRTAYIPKVICQTLGYKTRMIPDTKAALMFRCDATVEEILHSIHIIQETLVGFRKKN